MFSVQKRCDCGDQLGRSLDYIAKHGGMLIYLRQEGRGIGLTDKIKAYRLQEAGADTREANIMLGHGADERQYSRAVSILRKSGRTKIGLLTNNPDKIEALAFAGFDAKRIPVEIEAGLENRAYLETKKEKIQPYDTRRRDSMTIAAKLTAEGQRTALVLGRFNSLITQQLESGAKDALIRHGVSEDDIVSVWVPGAFEMPFAAMKLAKSGQFDSVICLGAVIRGATAHFDFVAAEAAKGVAQVSLETGLPVIFGVLTTESIEQALERAGTKAGNHGFNSAMTAIEMVNLSGDIRGL